MLGELSFVEHLSWDKPSANALYLIGSFTQGRNVVRNGAFLPHSGMRKVSLRLI